MFVEAGVKAACCRVATSVPMGQRRAIISSAIVARTRRANCTRWRKLAIAGKRERLPCGFVRVGSRKLRHGKDREETAFRPEDKEPIPAVTDLLGRCTRSAGQGNLRSHILWRWMPPYVPSARRVVGSALSAVVAGQRRKRNDFVGGRSRSRSAFCDRVKVARDVEVSCAVR